MTDEIPQNDCQGEYGFTDTIDRLTSHREAIKETIRRALRVKAEDFPPDSTARHFLWSHSYEAAEAALSAIEASGYVLMPKDQILRKMSKDMTERKAGNSRLVYNKVTRTIDTVRTTDIDDVCQADAGAKGETVSREGALQSGVSAEAVRRVSWKPEAFNIRSDENGQIFVSADGQPIMDFPARVALELGEALVTLAANSQRPIEEAQRADTERPVSAESSLTHKIPSPPQEKENA